jgi:hypothetical protein
MKTSTLKKLSRVLIAASGILTCAAGLASERSTSTVSRNVDVSHCEAFVERGALVFGNGQRMTLRFYIKLHSDRLDGAVTDVGFHGYKVDVGGVCKGETSLSSNPVCQNVGIWADYKSKPFVFESDDYHDIRLDVSDIDGDIFAYEGVFFLQTDVGTRYWIHAAQGRDNFNFDEEFLDSMVASKSAFDINEFDLSKVPTAKETRTGLNASSCD